jgi:hypothetical protein
MRNAAAARRRGGHVREATEAQEYDTCGSFFSGEQDHRGRELLDWRFWAKAHVSEILKRCRFFS